MDSTETPTNEPDDVESLASFSVRRESMVSSEENVLEVPSKESQDRHGDTNDSMISSTPLNHSFQRVMDESRVDLHNDWSPVMQRLELLKSQLESNDEVIHEMERNLKTKTPINELEKSEDDVEYLKRKVGSLEEKVSKAETIIYNLEEEIEEKNKLIEARTMVISVLQKDVEAKRISTNSMFEKTQQEIQNMHENFMAFKENMAAENKKLLDQLDSSRQRYRKLDSKLKEAEKEKGALVQLNNDLNFQIENIMILNNELKMKVVEITENIDSPKEKIRALTEELDSVKEEFQKTVLNLELEIAHYKGECEKIKKSFQDNQAFLEEEVIQLKQENKDLASIISSFEVEISSLESGRVEKEATLLAHVEEKESLISKMKRTMEGFCSERDGLLNRLTQAERDLETKESSFDRISSEVVELRAALDALKACGSSEEISCSLNNEINILQDQLCQCKNELQQEKQKVQMLTETIDELEEKIQDSDLLLIEEKQNNINIKKELEHLKHQIDEKEELVARERGNAAQLQENFCSVLNEVEQFKQLLRESNNETCDTQMKLQSAEEDKARLETVIGNLLRDVLSLTAKSTATEINFEKENHLYSILQEKFSELSTMFTQNSEDLKDKENTINILKADLEKVKQHQDQEDKVSLRDMEAYIQQQDEMINELEKRIKTKAEEVCHLTASCEELSQRMTDYANYTASEIGNRDNLIQNLQSLLANRNDGVDPTVDVQTLQARVNYLEQTLAEANSSLESQISKLKMVESENESFKLKIIEMNATLSDLRQNISVNEQQAIEKARQFDHLTSQYNDLLAKYNDVSATAARAESEFLAEANSNLETQILKLNIIESENDSLKAQIAEMNASLSDLRQNISVNEQQAIEKARQYDQITTQYNDLLGKYNDVSAYAAQAESELSNKEYIIQNLEIQGNTTRSEDAQRLQEDLNQLSTSLEKNTALLKEKDDAYLKLLSENDFIKNQLADNQQTLESKIEFCNKLQAKIDELTIEKENLSKFEARCFELSSQLEQLQLSDSDKNSEVQEELKQATNMMAHLSEENERLVNQVIELKDRLESAKLVEMEKIALKDELYALKEELSTKSTLQTKVQDLEKSVKEKDILISELQIQKGGQSEDFTKNSSPGLSENGDVSGKLLPLAQEYLRINCQLMILKDLLEDLINCEVDVLSPDSELKSILESLESDLQESEAVLKTYETKLRRSPGFNTESLESSVSAMRSFVDQITKQISTCGEILKDWVLVKTPPKKSTFSTETQTEFPMESKGTSRLTSENLDDWNWDVENNEESEIKFGDNLLFYGSAPGQNQAHFQENPASLVSNLDESASVDPKQKHSIEIMHGSVPSTPLGYEAEASKSIENEFSKLQVSENQVAYSSENIDPPHDGTEIPEPYYFSPEEQRVAYDELKKSLVPGFNRNPETLEYTFHDDQSHSHECSREPSHEHTHVNDHEHNHTHDHGHGHEHDHEHNHAHDHERHEHDHEHSTHDENYRLVPAVYENDNNGESEYSDYSQFTSDGYLQENQLIVMNKAYVEDMKVKLDSVLYKLHEKDVQNNELTRELIELLKERDILQLKLSSAYRLLANQEKEETDSDQTSDSLKNTELISKINELDSLSGWHDAMMKSESEQKNMQALYSNQALPRNLKTQNSNPIESDSESAIYSLYNWITGSR